MWIRTQNIKGLIEAICITCSGGNDKYTLYADAIGFEDYVLGTYATEQRALEVLDEIQTTLIKVLKDADNRHEIVWVYEMPKE
jgi:hypothetical protein